MGIFNIFFKRNKKKAEDYNSIDILTSVFSKLPENLCLLVIDDNACIRDSIKTYFTSKGITIETASNGQIGLEKYAVSPERYNAILLDIEMPVMSGIEFLKRLQTLELKRKNIPILVMTGSNMSDIVGMCNGYIYKPFDMEELEAKLIGILE